MQTEEAKIKFPIFSQRFNELRGKMSQADFAIFLGISRPTVGFYENGDRLPDALTLRKIAERCNVPSDWLIGLTNNKSLENIDTGKQLGLSDGSISVLQFFNNEMPDGQSFISTINYLLEQEYPDPYDIGDWGDQIIQDWHTKWESKNYIPILSSISNYLRVSLSNDKVFEITESGELEEQYTGTGFKLKYDVVKSISKNNIIEKVLLLEIEERLQKMKEKGR
jgi:transcriptional regulator with XRE-family HTH domain